MSYELTHHAARSTPALRRLAAAFLTLGMVATSACNSLLAVDNPGRVPVADLDDPSIMPILEAAAIGTFECGAVNYAATAGMLSGEYWSANGFVNNHPWEWRGIVQIKGEPGSCNYNRMSTFMGFYTPLQQARFQLEDTYARVEKFTNAQVPTRPKILAEMRAYAGYAYLLLGEGMCSMTVDGGPRMTTAQTLAIAKQRFTDAIALATAINDSSLWYMSLVGRARTQLDLGTAADLAGAAADASAVPQGFVRVAEFSETTQSRENRIYDLTIVGEYLSVAPPYQGLTVNGAPDPRVPVLNTGRIAQDNVTPLWLQQKFIGSGAVPLPIASWAEAQLIYAEATGGQAGLDAINRVRAASNIGPLVLAPGDDFEAAVLEERRRQLFSEGQRYGDMLRKGLPFQMGTNGTNRKGQTYSSLTCVPLPDVETLNNPNLGS